ncbi:MAG: type I secretion protein TolC [Rhodanobacter sp.]|nr:MAG: type I secretion protein TolC [Rhodanobacter sp.]TAM08803.1 MAG: type I secretion protein TolC [Rhodanobacter sp.]TAM36845.1 MAG: type I secretion protein TolC [Rhodanobacter sp.]
MRLKLLTVALALAAISLPGHGEDLLDAYREARANDPVLAQADATRLATGEGVTQARALLLPQINGSLALSQTNGGTGGRFQDPNNPGQFLTSSAIGHSRTRSLNANLSQTVFDFSKYANLKAAHSSANAQDQLYQAALQNLYVRVTGAYFTVLTDEDQLAFAKANEDALKQQFDQADQRFKVGLAAVTDVYQAKSAYEAARTQTIAAKNTLDNDREALTQITGRPTGDLKKLRDQLPMQAPDPADPDAWVQKALAANPNLMAQKDNLSAAEHNITSARAGHLPTLTAGVNYGKSSSWYENAAIHSNTPSTTTVGLTLNVPIFSGGATQSRVRQAIYNRDAAQDSVEIERRQLRAATLNYYRSVLAGVSQVESGKAAVESAQKALDATRAGFDVGTQTMVNVLIAIQTLTQAESSYSQARHQLVLNRLLLKQSAGAASLSDLQDINALLQ